MERLQRCLIRFSSIILLALPLKAQLSPSAPSVVKDINTQGYPDSFPEELRLMGDKLCFIPPDNPDFVLELVDMSQGSGQKNIEVSTNNKWPDNLSERASSIFFAATTEDHGRELWKTDGTFAGTSLVKDIFPGEESGDPSSIIEVDGTIFFTADDGTTGRELWKSDGTEQGTVMVEDIRPEGHGSSPKELAAIGATLVFIADGRLWRSDGSEAGTYPLYDSPIYTFDTTWWWPGGPGDDYLIHTDQAAYFVVSDPENGLRLWLTDGTLEGTQPFSNFHPEVSSYQLDAYYLKDSNLYFISNNQLWKTSDTPETATKIHEFSTGMAYLAVSPLGTFVMSFETLYFLQHGTDQLTTLLTDLPQTEAGAEIIWTRPTIIGNNAILQFEYWEFGSSSLIVSDGTVEGTQYISEVGGILRVIPSNNDRTIITVISPFSDFEYSALWSTDGTVGGTVLLTEDIGGEDPLSIGNGVLVSSPGHLTNDWFSDGTPEGTIAIPRYRGTLSSYPENFTAGNQGQVYFTATTNQYGRELWKSDGTEDGTSLVRDISSGPPDSSPENLILQGSQLFFTAETEAQGRELWTSDGTEEGTTLVADLTPGTDSSDFSYLGTTNSFAYTVTKSGDDTKLWRTDGTPEGTSCLATYTTSLSKTPQSFTSGPNGLLFVTRHSETSELWFADDHTEELILLRSGWGSYSEPNGLLEHEGQFYFRARVPGVNNSTVLWTSDGTPEGTEVLLETYPGAIYVLPDFSSLLFVHGDFRRYDLTTGDLHTLGNFNDQGFSENFGRSTIVHDTLFIESSYQTSGKNLVAVDGTPGEITDLRLPPEICTDNLSSVGSNLYVTWESHPYALDPVAPKLWKLPVDSPDGAFTPVLNSDGDSIINPTEVAVSGNRAFFSCINDNLGYELYSFEVGISLDPSAQVSEGSALITGKIDPRESLTSALLEYGITPDLGSFLPIALPPPGSTDWTNFTVDISNLLPSTTYYYRVSASNEYNTFTSPIQSFTTANAPPVFWGWALNTSQEIPASISTSTLLTNIYDHEGHAVDLTLTSSRSSQGGNLTLVDGNLIYTPPLGYSGTDSLLITLTDELGASSEAIIHVYIQAPPGQDTPPGNTLTLTHSPSGSHSIHFTGLPGRIYLVQRSTDLKIWTTITTLIADGNGVIQSEDLDPTPPSLFYRIAR